MQNGSVGILTHTKAGDRDVTGGVSLTLDISDSSFGLLKNESVGHICITKFRKKIYVEGRKCY
jgi:hypothetical protein